MSGDATSTVKWPFGHEFALSHIVRGENVIKYGEVIGEATADIGPGAWAHMHNVVGGQANERVQEGAGE